MFLLLLMSSSRVRQFHNLPDYSTNPTTTSSVGVHDVESSSSTSSLSSSSYLPSDADYSLKIKGKDKSYKMSKFYLYPFNIYTKSKVLLKSSSISWSWCGIIQRFFLLCCLLFIASFFFSLGEDSSLFFSPNYQFSKFNTKTNNNHDNHNIKSMIHFNLKSESSETEIKANESLKKMERALVSKDIYIEEMNKELNTLRLKAKESNLKNDKLNDEKLQEIELELSHVKKEAKTCHETLDRKTATMAKVSDRLKEENLVKALQKTDRIFLEEYYGGENYKVEGSKPGDQGVGNGPLRITFEFEDSEKYQPITIETALFTEMPHTIRWFVSLVDIGWWDGCGVARNAPHVLQMNCQSRKIRHVHNPSIVFQEWDPNIHFNHLLSSVTTESTANVKKNVAVHEKYTLGVAGRYVFVF